MKIAGIHSWHDCSFCVLDDGRPIMHAELERYAREKEVKGDALQLLFDKYQQHDDITYFVHTLDVSEGGIRSRHPQTFARMQQIASKNNGEFIVVGHHAAHAGHAFYSSNYDTAMIITIDGGGEELDDNQNVIATSLTLWKGVKNKLTRIAVAPYSEINIGALWSRCTEEIFDLSVSPPKGHQAGTVMALAAMGNHDKWGDVFLATNLKPEHFVHSTQRKRYYEAVKMQEKTGKAEWWGTVPPSEIAKHKAAIDVSLDFPHMKELAKNNEQTKFDIAAGLQYATENIIKKYIDFALALPEFADVRHVCIGGGVALNSVMTGKLYDWYAGKIDGFYVPPVPHDAGLSIGAAQIVWHHMLNNPRIVWHDNFTPYLGEVYDANCIQATIAAQKQICNITCVNANDDDVLKLLDKQNIVAVYGGGSESGRRALGNRSILADPRNFAMKDMINQKVKHRQWFRPFAPSILREYVHDWFVHDIDSPYMGFVVKFRDTKCDKVPAVVHFDGTARLQTVTKNDNLWYHNFLTKWYDLSQVPILLNTSFNDREPIVESPEHAIECFKKTDIDYLYFYDAGLLISKTA